MSFPFALEPRDKNAMKRNPKSASARRVLTKELQNMILLLSVVTGLILVVLYYVLLQTRGEAHIDEIRTIMFVTLSLDALCFSFSLKSLDTPVWRINLCNNRYLLGTLFFSIGLMVLALTWSPLMTLLSLTPLLLGDVFLLVGVGLINLMAIELLKWFFFVRPARSGRLNIGA
jgi:magnesium-transporting ATPase (P-type)